MNTVECNNCEWSGDEDDLVLIEFDAQDPNETPTAVEDQFCVDRLSNSPENVEFMKGCPNCRTDSYLADIENQ